MTVETSRGEYPIRFVDVAEAFAGLPVDVRTVTDSNLSRLYPDLLDGRTVRSVLAGESSKCLGEFGRCTSWLAETGANRRTTVVAFGGGVVGDLAGFVAAAYMRGVDLVMVPTSLMAMVDSSIGGKVAIDLPEGKNLVGAFWPPREVRVATGFLKTLPHRELLCGAAEVWKYGLTLDAGLLAELETQPLGLGSDLDGIVRRCLELKAEVVQNDEFETTGRRAVLNFGHTVGHAIEALQEYRGLNHGEAVAVGMVVEARLGERIGVTEPGTADRARLGLALQGLPTVVPEGLAAEALADAMRRDKKVEGQGLTFSLVERPGECKLIRGVERSAVLEALAIR
ncbi:MAG: 3-dehydroquinate synthase [Armatimonadetes bacterium]|nr:3-dehydroquinate synthase [Armatimonadota bacterium]